MITCGADKQIVFRNINLDVVGNSSAEQLSETSSEEFIQMQKKEQCKNKVFAMDISQNSGYAVTGHDKLVSVWQVSNTDRIWEKRPESTRKSGTMDQLKV